MYGVQHDLILEVGREDVLLFWTERRIIISILLQRYLIGSPEETQLGLCQFVEHRILKGGVLLDTKRLSKEHWLFLDDDRVRIENRKPFDLCLHE